MSLPTQILFLSDKPTSRYTTSYADGLLQGEYAHSKLKSVKRVGTNKFHVEMKEDDMIISPSSLPFDADDTDRFRHMHLPLFCQIRQVSIDERGTMFCTCSKFERCEYFCADQVCAVEVVYQASCMPFLGFTHHDVACCYCTVYMYMAYKPSTSKAIQMLLTQLALDDVQGPTLIINIDGLLIIEEPRPILSALDRLTNYNKETTFL